MPELGRSTYFQEARCSWTRTARRGWSAGAEADVTRGRVGDRSGAAMRVFYSVEQWKEMIRWFRSRPEFVD